MQVMLGHVDLRVTHDALDGLQVHAQVLHLRNIGVPAAMGCQNPNPCPLKRFLKLVAEISGIAGLPL